MVRQKDLCPRELNSVVEDNAYNYMQDRALYLLLSHSSDLEYSIIHSCKLILTTKKI